MDYAPHVVACSFCGKDFDPWKFLSAFDLTRASEPNPRHSDETIMHCCRDCHEKGMDKPL